MGLRCLTAGCQSLLQAGMGLHLEPAELLQDVHDHGILLVLGHGRGVCPDLIHHSQDVAPASILLEVLVVMQLIDGLHSRQGYSGGAALSPFSLSLLS